jgi:hypothetical protein
MLVCMMVLLPVAAVRFAMAQDTRNTRRRRTGLIGQKCLLQRLGRKCCSFKNGPMVRTLPTARAALSLSHLPFCLLLVSSCPLAHFPQAFCGRPSTDQGLTYIAIAGPDADVDNYIPVVEIFPVLEEFCQYSRLNNRRSDLKSVSETQH